MKAGAIPEDLTAQENVLTSRDAAEILYRHGAGGTFVTATAAVAIFFMLHDTVRPLLMMTWLALTLLTAGTRALDIFAGAKRRQATNWDGRAEARRFTILALASALMWGLLPLTTFHQLSQVHQAALATILSGMAAGGATVFATMRPLCIAYCTTLLLPLAAMFFLTPSRENVILGGLTVMFWIIMAGMSKVTNSAAMSAIRLYRSNQSLVIQTERERQRSEDINAELMRAQAELGETLATLEDRIAARTADLEHEISERERFARELARLASRDALTGLYNRANLTDRLERELARAARAKESIAVLFLDLDKFKEVNDLKGHQWGDHVLREVALRLTKTIPLGSIAARWGGDEFVFILSERAHARAAVAIGEELRGCVGDPILRGAESVRIDATIGIALFPEHGTSADELIGAADMAMYAAKEAGHERVRVFEPVLADAVHTRLLLGAALREAIGQNALRLEYQPIVAACSGRCAALEALLRWNHPTRGPISPIEFIPLAERSGDIIPIGRWVLAQACIAAAGWPGDPAPAVSVNVSVAQIEAGGVLDDVCAALAASGLDARRLHVEVTESLFASNNEQIIPTLVALRAMGVRISIDDFGTGFSSLGSLQSLPIDTLKIDKTFVDRVEGDSAAIITAIRSLAYALEIDIVAEGVENDKQAALLRTIGVHFFQGYLYARPLPAKDVSAWLIATGTEVPDSWPRGEPKIVAGAR